MQKKDFLIIALVPLALLLIPLSGQLTVEGWHWKSNDFAFAWVVFAFATWVYRFLVTRPVANFAYKAGVALAIVTGFLVFWITLAAQIIGEDNPGNGLYLRAILGGFLSVGVARFRPAGLAIVVFGMAAALLLIPVVAVFFWPSDFSPGYPKVQGLSAVFAALFAAAGLPFRRAASQPMAASLLVAGKLVI